MPLGKKKSVKRADVETFLLSSHRNVLNSDVSFALIQKDHLFETRNLTVEALVWSEINSNRNRKISLRDKQGDFTLTASVISDRTLSKKPLQVSRPDSIYQEQHGGSETGSTDWEAGDPGG